ncbi:hypothetical protein CBL_20473 [Carabus blaptoides fortunei]
MKLFQRIFLFVNLLNTIFAQSTPLTLDYKPIKPFYWPANFIYPQPMIPPGTPWPATYTTDALVTNKINSELPIKSNEENRNGLLVPTTFSTVESSTTNIVESSSRSPTEENIFNLLCLIIPCLSTSIHKETENPLEQIVNYTTSSNDIDSTKNDVSVSTSYESSSDKIITPIPDTDIRIKPAETFDPDMIVFPDQLIAATIANKFEASNIVLPAVVSKTSSEECNKTSEELKDKSKPAATDDATLKPPTTTVINLEYKPTRPPHVPNPVFYPQPVIKPDTPKPLAEEVVTSKPVTTTLKPSSTTIIDLEYKPTRPTFIPGPVVYPQPAIKPETSKPLAEEDATSKPSLTTLKPSSTTIIDLEYKPTRPTFIPGPVVYPQPAIKPETSKPLAEEDVTSKPSLTTIKPSSTTMIDLEYKPTRPTFIPGPVVYPQPAIKPETSKPFAEEAATSKPSSTTIIDLEYKPTRPTFIPGPVIYPQPAIKPETSKPLGEEDATSKPSLTTLKPSLTTIIDLEYKPTRPPFIPGPVVYPQPAIKPETSKPLAEEDATSKPSSTIVVNLEYKPTRPTFIPDPVVYPQPAINTSSSVIHSSGSTFSTLSDKFATSLLTNTASPSGNNEITTKRIITTRKPVYSTPISLEYKPTRPPYVPNPIFYPKPAIPPGTPWPAYSTTKSLLTNYNLV